MAQYLEALAILLIVLGEALAIYAEMLGAKDATVASNPILQVFLKMFLVMVIAGGFLIAGYMLGFKTFKNIWVVSVISIAAILVIEPILAYSVFKQLPTRGAAIGFILGVLGAIAALFF